MLKAPETYLANGLNDEDLRNSVKHFLQVFQIPVCGKVTS